VNKQTCGSNDILSRIAKCPLCHIERSDSAVEISHPLIPHTLSSAEISSISFRATITKRWAYFFFDYPIFTACSRARRVVWFSS